MNSTGNPEITGTPQVRQTLTVGVGDMAAADGLPTTTFQTGYTFQWIRVDGDNETDVGSNQNTYRLVAADAGKEIKVMVDFTDGENNVESLFSETFPTVGYPIPTIAAAKTACPTGNEWCATLTAGYREQGPFTGPFEFYGYNNHNTRGYGSLDDDSISYGAGNSRDVNVIDIQNGVNVNNTSLRGRFDDYLPNGSVLNIGGVEFALSASNATSITGSYQWESLGGLTMVLGQELRVSVNIAPTLSTATVDLASLVLTYHEDLDESSVPVATQYTVAVDGTHRAVSSVAISGKTVTLTLESPVTVGQTVTVSYGVPRRNPLQDEASLAAVALTDQAVTNNTANSAATGAPEVAGLVQVGETLTASLGTIADTGGLPATFPDDYSFQWVLVDDGTDTDISGATSATYTPAAADEGKQIKVEMSFTDGQGVSEGPLASALSGVVLAEPDDCATDRPGADWCTTITVGTLISTTLSSRYGIQPHSTYFGINGGGKIPDRSINSEYTVRELAIFDYVHARPRVVFRTHEETWLPSGTIFNFGGTEFDADTGAIRTQGATGGIYSWYRPDNFSWIKGQKVTVSANLSAATGAPEILGTPPVGKTLTAKIGTIRDRDGLPDTFPDDYTFQWVRVDGETETDISGATSDTYTLTTADEGKRVKIKVSFTDDSGSEEALKSGAYPNLAYNDTTKIVSASADDPDGTVLLNTSLTVVEYVGGLRNRYYEWGCSGDTYCADAMGKSTFKSTAADNLERSFKITALQVTLTSTGRHILSLFFDSNESRLSNYEKKNLVLELDGRKFRFDGADLNGCSIQLWNDVSERWDDGHVVQVRILDRGTDELGTGCKPRATVRSAIGYEGRANLKFPVILSPASTTQVTVDYQTSDGSATSVVGPGESPDFTATSGTLTFAPGETRKEILVPIIDDSVFDPYEQMYLTLKNASSGVEVFANDGRLKGTATVAGYIFNSEDDPTPELSVRDAEATEGADKFLGFVVTMTPEMPVPVKVDYATSDGTATAGSDYTSTSGTLTFAAGETTKRVSVTITPDAVAEEGGETLTLTLSNPSGADAVLGDSTAVGTIWDSLTVEFKQVPVSHDGTNTFTFRVLIPAYSGATAAAS